MKSLGEKVWDLRAAAANSEAVRGHTHNYYRYPARFPPIFVREAIEAFSKPYNQSDKLTPLYYSVGLALGLDQ